MQRRVACSVLVLCLLTSPRAHGLSPQQSQPLRSPSTVTSGPEAIAGRSPTCKVCDARRKEQQEARLKNPTQTPASSRLSSSAHALRSSSGGALPRRHPYSADIGRLPASHVSHLQRGPGPSAEAACGPPAAWPPGQLRRLLAAGSEEGASFLAS